MKPSVIERFRAARKSKAGKRAFWTSVLVTAGTGALSALFPEHAGAILTAVGIFF